MPHKQDVKVVALPHGTGTMGYTASIYGSSFLKSHGWQGPSRSPAKSAHKSIKLYIQFHALANQMLPCILYYEVYESFICIVNKVTGLHQGRSTESSIHRQPDPPGRTQKKCVHTCVDNLPASALPSYSREFLASFWLGKNLTHVSLVLCVCVYAHMHAMIVYLPDFTDVWEVGICTVNLCPVSDMGVPTLVDTDTVCAEGVPRIHSTRVSRLKSLLKFQVA